MKVFVRKTGKRITAVLLALLLTASAPAALAAEKGGSSLSPQVSDNSSSALPGYSADGSETEWTSSPDPQQPEESSSAQEETSSNASSSETSSTVSQPDGEDSSLPAESGDTSKDTDQDTYEAAPLLVTGGHKTYLNGYTGGTFNPERAMSRAEVAVMLYALLAAKPSVDKSQFSDVSISAWYGVAVNSLAKAGIINGYKDGTFDPNGKITRAEFVTVLSQCFALSSGSTSFSDVGDNYWAYDYIASASSKGWISGYKDGTFRPENSLKRSEATSAMNSALDRKGDGYAADRNMVKFKDVPTTYWAFLDITEAADPVGGTTTPTPDPEDPTEPKDFKVGQTVMVTATGGLNLRSQANSTSTIVTVLASGAVLTITELTDTTWIKVKTSNGSVGYVHTDYVEAYTPGQASGATLSTSSISLSQYQTARVDGSVTSGLDSMSWTSSDPNVAVVGYTVAYSSKKEGGMIYGKSPGTATITFSNSAGTSKVTCKVTVTAAEGVRYGYSSLNIVPKGGKTNLLAITDSSRTGVKFVVVNGSTYETTTYDSSSRASTHGLPVNTVRTFKKEVTFSTPGTYTVRAYSKNASGYSSDYYEFTFMVSASSSSDTSVTTSDARRASTEIISVIAQFEGLVPEVKDDLLATGNPTVGHGYVVPVNGKFYNNMTEAEALAQLVNTVNRGGYSSSVESFRSRYNIKMSQSQFDALVSFVYNLGAGVLDPDDYDTPNVMLNAVVPPADASATKTYSGTLNTVDANIYKEASASSSIVKTLSGGTAVSVIGTKRDAANRQMWYQVKAGSSTGWIRAGYVRLSGSFTRDLAYADSMVLSNNFLQWHKASGTCYPGLLWRRLAESKIFFYANYKEAYHTNAKYDINTYGFSYPGCCQKYDYRE